MRGSGGGGECGKGIVGLLVRPCFLSSTSVSLLSCFVSLSISVSLWRHLQELIIFWLSQMLFLSL